MFILSLTFGVDVHRVQLCGRQADLPRCLPRRWQTQSERREVVCLGHFRPPSRAGHGRGLRCLVPGRLLAWGLPRWLQASLKVGFKVGPKDMPSTATPLTATPSTARTPKWRNTPKCQTSPERSIPIAGRAQKGPRSRKGSHNGGHNGGHAIAAAIAAAKTTAIAVTIVATMFAATAKCRPDVR